MDGTTIVKVLIGIAIVFAFCGTMVCSASAANIIVKNYIIKQLKREFMSEYKRYKPYLFNQLELHNECKILNVSLICSDPFTTNSELRHSFMQVANYMQSINNMYGHISDLEIEQIFLEICRVAWLNGEELIQTTDADSAANTDSATNTSK